MLNQKSPPLFCNEDKNTDNKNNGRETEDKNDKLHWFIDKPIPVAPVEEQTPLFLYKGKIASGSRSVVLIEQTRSGETLMVSQGEQVDGYKVLDISDTKVILSKKGAEDIVLETEKTP